MSLLRGLPALLFAAGAHTAGTNDWPDVRGEPGGSRFSALSQINRQNVRDLRIAWTYRTGDSRPASTIECTPIVVQGVLYLTTARTRVVALDAATGQERWRFDPEIGRRFPAASGGVNRGVAYWSDGRSRGERRILLGAADGRLISLDARTGRPDPAFGRDGEVDLRAGRNLRWGWSVTSPAFLMASRRRPRSLRMP